MRKSVTLMLILAGALSAAAAAAAEGGTAKTPRVKLAEEAARRRAQTRRIYNAAFSGNIMKNPKRAEAAFAGAQKKMEKINPKDPGDPSIGRALFQRGFLSMEAGAHKQAVKLSEEMVRRFPRHVYADDALYRVGYIHQHYLKDPARAAAAYTRLARMYRDRETASQAMYQQARVAVQQQKIGKVVRYLNDAQGNANGQRVSRGAPIPNYYEAQSDHMLRFIARNTEPKESSRPLALYLKGEDDLKEGRFKTAEKSFAEIIKKYPKSKLADDAEFGTAECRRRQLELKQAAGLYEAFIKKHPRSELAPAARFRLAELKRVAGQEGEAGRLYREVRAELDRRAAGGKGRGKLSPEMQRFRDIADSRLKEMAVPSK